MNSCINESDTAYFDYLLRLAIMGATKASEVVTIPEPPITPYDPVYYPKQSTSISPDITTFNTLDQMSDFDFALSLTSKSINDTSPDSSKQRKHEGESVAKPVLP